MAARSVGLAAVGVGLLVALGAGLSAPLTAPPLYDGVVVVAPYVWVTPPAGKPGGAKGAVAHVAISGHQSPFVAVATVEQPPQAQVIAPPRGLTLAPGTTSLAVSIAPLDPSVDPSSGPDRVLGNVYRILVVDQAGRAVTAPASAYVSVVLRAPETLPDASLARFVDGSWQRLGTDAGYGDSYAAVVTAFGDFAVVTAAASGSPAAGPSIASASGSAPPSGAASSTSSVPPLGSASGQPAGSPAGPLGTAAAGTGASISPAYVLLLVVAGAVVAGFALVAYRGGGRR